MNGVSAKTRELINPDWRTQTLERITAPVKNAWKPGEQRLPYIGLEHIEEQNLKLNGCGTSETVESNKFRFRRGDILFGKLRPYFRKVVRVDFEGVCSTDIWVFRANQGFDQGYLFYFLANPSFVDKATRASSGTRMPRADWKFLQTTQWVVPPLPEQKAIAAVLSSLDDKIELLRRQNETLEKIAQTLFKEWFVEFNFPDKNGKPYKASGGKMVDSELGPIPSGWRAGVLSDIAAVDWGNTSITKSSYVDSGDYLGVSAAGCDGRMVYKEHNYGAFVISAIGEYCGRVFLPSEDFTAIKNTLVVTQHNVPDSYFAYLGMQTWPIHRRGAAQPFLSKGDTEQIPFANPGEAMIRSFTDSVSPLFGKLRRNSLQVGTLSKLRDALLPKLMSGELRVGGA